MTDLSYFESRAGQLTGSPEEVFTFVTDIRNFERFIPEGIISNWKSDKESCSFSVSILGTVSVRLAEKERYTKVVFSGDALKKNDFLLTLNITDNISDHAEVKISLSAELNPMMKMMAVKPIGQFLEKLVNEMEGFRDWKKSIK
jgi:carbon monoxide dehydrogenase subunit G